MYGFNCGYVGREMRLASAALNDQRGATRQSSDRLGDRNQQSLWSSSFSFSLCSVT